MKKRRSFIGFVLIILIISGLGYIGYSFVVNPGMISMLGINKTTNTDNTSNTSNTQNGNNTMTGMDMSNNKSTQTTDNQLSNSIISQISLQNKEKLNNFITQLTDAINQITINPYSNITMPGNVITDNNNQLQPQQQQQRNTTVNIYPNATNPTQIETNKQSNNQPQTANTNNVATNQPTVYNQNKLEQIHSAIFKLSQGMMLLNELSEDISAQASTIESNPPNYQTYLIRYNIALKNKSKFNNALNFVNSAATIINVNPYSSASGYQYNLDAMEQLDKGIYKLGQAMGIASEINTNYTSQIASAGYDLNNYGSMSNMNMNTNTPIFNGIGSFFSLSNLPFVFTILLGIFAVMLVIGIFGAINSLFKPKEYKKMILEDKDKDN